MAKTFPSLRMLTLHEVTEIARRVEGTDDVRITCEDLARGLGVHTGTLAQWRNGKRFPSDETMIALCTRAKIDPMEGLMLLNVWRSKGRVRDLYMKWLRSQPYHYVWQTAPEVVVTGIGKPHADKTIMATLREQIAQSSA